MVHNILKTIVGWYVLWGMYVLWVLVVKLAEVCSFFQTSHSFIKKTDERLKVHSVLF